MRSARSFMARSSRVVIGLVSSAMGRRAWRRSGLELRQLALPERAVRKLRVRDHELRLAHDAIAEANDVQVQGAGSPPHLRATLATARRFDRVQVVEQLGGLEGGLEQDHLVEVGALRYRPERGSLLDAGLLEQAGLAAGRAPVPAARGDGRGGPPVSAPPPGNPPPPPPPPPPATLNRPQQ